MRRALTRLIWTLLAVFTAVAGWALYGDRIPIPPRWNPWAPLDIAEPPGLLTGYKLGRLVAEPGACRAWLEGAGVVHTPLDDRADRNGCGWESASRVTGVGREPGAANANANEDAAGQQNSGRDAAIGPSSQRRGESAAPQSRRAAGVAFSSPFTLSCPATAGLAMWERHVLQPAAREHLGSSVVAIDHLGSFACRNVYGRSEGRRSEHASANALDVAGFRLADGRRVSVLRDWGPVESWRAAPPAPDHASPASEGLPGLGTATRGNIGTGNIGTANIGTGSGGDAESRQADPLPPAARFLRQVHQGACPYFGGVFGPAYNAAHRDHLHLDRGPYRICR